MSRRDITHVPRTVPPGQLRRTLEAVRRFRSSFVFGTLLLLFALLLGRLAKLQIVEADHYRALAERRHASAVKFPPRRGQVLDRFGWPLATSRPARTVSLDPHPAVIQDVPSFALQVAAILGGEPGARTIQKIVLGAREKAAEASKPVSRYVVIRRRIEDPLLIDRLDTVAAFTDTMRLRAGIYGLRVEREEIRTYPCGAYAAHIVGEVPPTSASHRIGIEGHYHGYLSGRAAKIQVRRDGRRRLMADPDAIDRSGVRGGDITTTLDLVIQHFLETALDDVVATWTPHEACGIVLDPHTGHLLALANRPTYDPNRRGRTREEALRGRFNWALQGQYEPGSIFKPFTVAAALEAGVVQPDEVFGMPSSLRLPGEKRDIRDTHWIGDGTVVLLLTQSSNTGAAWLAHQLGGRRMHALYDHLGLDRPTGLGFRNEAGGRLPPKMAKREVWPPWLTHTAGFGQGFSITPMQMACTFAAFARDDGCVVRPTLIVTRQAHDPRGPCACPPEHLPTVREGLERCVTEGTARGAFALARYSAAGKTGTAQQRSKDGEFNICSLIAYAPAEDPQVVVLVLARLERDRAYGATVAGPAVRSVIDQTLAYWRVTEGEHLQPTTAAQASPDDARGDVGAGGPLLVPAAGRTQRELR